MKFIFRTIVLLLFCCSCNNEFKYSHSDSFTWEDFGEPILIELEPTVIKEPPLLTRKMIVQDSLLLFHSQGTENLIYTYHLHTGEKLYEYLPFGSGPGEMLGIWEMIKNDTLIWLLFTQNQQISAFPFTSFTKQEPLQETYSYVTEDYISSLAAGGHDTLISLTRIPNGGRLGFFDYKGQFLMAKGEYPFYGEELTPLEKIEGFVGCICSNTEAERAYVFYGFTDLLEIYDFQGNLLKRMQGPDGFFPQVKQRNKDGVSTVSTRTAKDAYVEPCIGENMIFVMYMGTEYTQRETKTILVFNKEGKPLKNFRLKEDILTFTVDAKNKTVYVVTMEDFNIKRFIYE